MTERQRLRKRLAEINERIAEVEQWGALLTALNEERQGILARLLNNDFADDPHD